MKKIIEVNVPQKVTKKWLESIGFTGSNDQSIIKVLKALGFIDTSGTPTNLWRQYRNKELAPKVMANAIKNAYKPLFDTYPDAHRKDKEALRNFFASKTGHSERTLEKIILTFKALCNLADFENEDESTTPVNDATELVNSASQSRSLDRLATGFAININIQLQLPETHDEEVYDKLFRSLKRNLLSS